MFWGSVLVAFSVYGLLWAALVAARNRPESRCKVEVYRIGPYSGPRVDENVLRNRALALGLTDNQRVKRIALSVLAVEVLYHWRIRALVCKRLGMELDGRIHIIPRLIERRESTTKERSQ